VNGGAIAGNFALIDRGTCTFVAKAQAAQAAGATGLIVANNVAAGLRGMGGTDPTITIPCVGISQADGNAIKAQLAGGVKRHDEARSDAEGRHGREQPRAHVRAQPVRERLVGFALRHLAHTQRAAGAGDQSPTCTTTSTSTLPVPRHRLVPGRVVRAHGDPPTGVCGEKVVLTATISPLGDAKGTIEFFDGLTSLGIGDVVNNTTATLSTTLTAGTHNLKAMHKCFTCSTYVVSPELPYDVSCPTPALLSLFRADPLGSGIELRWQFGDKRFVDSWVERGPAATGRGRRSRGPTAAPRAEPRWRWIARRRPGPRTGTGWWRARRMARSSVFGPLQATAGSVVWRSELSAVRPNPGNGNFTFDFAVPREASVRLSVLDVQGREVALLYNGSRDAGLYQAVWSGRDLERHEGGAGYVLRALPGPDKVHFSRVVLAR
jgi:hypothetical protein